MTWLKFTRPRDIRFWLSKLVPVPMSSTYGVIGQVALAEGGVIDETGKWREHATWVQWRGRIYRHHITRLTDRGVLPS
jgi:hypothetical protein